ncbi:choice-of-anchor A family protein [Desulfatitalea alkaliphila]|uniref:Choice-of-anchor A family protein n=1 Tax=Desulfatitalea alkaliphila TaxID=2929485 RepID=A0AA41R7M4_9BACT|nr:choice-of-anchor A family protein [Desulfatitalea alkaliphila]
MTDPNGAYGLAGLTAGEMTITAFLEGYHAVSASVAPDDGARLIFSPQLESSSQEQTSANGALAGTVVDAISGRGLEGVWVSLTYPSGETFDYWTERDGLMLIENLDTDVVAVAFNLPGYLPMTGQVTLQGGLTIDVGEVRLQPEQDEATATVSGYLVDVRSRLPVAGAVLSAVNLADNATAETISDAEGRFDLSGLTGGEYHFSIDASAYAIVGFHLIAAQGQALDLGEIRLRKPGIDALLPDLSILALDVNEIFSTPEDFAVSGTLRMTLINRGNAPVEVPFEVHAYEDLHGYGVPGDDARVFGSVVVSASPANPIAVDGTIDVALPVSGRQSFRDAPILVVLDPANVLVELSKANNTSNTAGLCVSEHKPILDLCLCMDASGSVSSADFQLQLEGTARAIEDENIVPRDGTVRVSAFQFAGSSRLELNPTIIEEDNVHHVTDTIRAIRKLGGGTSIHDCINKAADLLVAATPSSVLQVIDLSTDGQSNQSQAISAATRAGDMGIDVLNAIGVGSGINVNLLNSIVFPQPAGGERGFVTLISGYQEYIEGIAGKIQRETRMADLTVGGVRFIDGGYGSDGTIAMVIGNSGAASISENVVISVYDGAPEQGGRHVEDHIFTDGFLPGGFAEVRIEGLPPTAFTSGELVVIVRIDGDFAECNQENNRQAIPVLAMLGSIELNLNGNRFGPGQTVDLTSRVFNTGSLEGRYRVLLQVLDQDGVAVHVFDAIDAAAIPVAESADFTAQWSTGRTLAGAYNARAQLMSLDGSLLDASQTSFVISELEPGDPPGGTAAASIRAATDRPQYHVTDDVVIELLVQNTTTVHPMENTVVQVVVSDPDGVIVHADTISIGTLMPGGTEQSTQKVHFARAPTGTYRLVATLADVGGTVYADSHSGFEVINDMQRSVQGTVRVAEETIYAGAAQICTYEVVNAGAAAIEGLPIHQLVVQMADEAVMDTENDAVDLPVGADATRSKGFATAGYAPGTYACVLQAMVNDEIQDLAHALFQVEPPPIVIDGDIAIGHQGRLLVLRDPISESDTVAVARNEYLRQLLRNAGWLATFVDNGADFAMEMAGGGYSLYALMSRSVKLNKPTQETLNAKIAQGDGLLVAGGHDRRNRFVEEALGIAIHGNVALAGGVGVEASDLGEAWTSDFNVPGKVLSFVPQTAAVIAQYIRDGESAGENGPSCLGETGAFNALVFEDFSSVASAVEGRLAVGGQLNLNHYRVGNKVSAHPLSNVVVVGGDVHLPLGKIFNGHLVAQGSIGGVGMPVLKSMARGATAQGQVDIPLDFAMMREYMEGLSADIADLPATGTGVIQYGTLTLSGDGTSELQVFCIDAVDLMTAHTFRVHNIPAGASVIFNIPGPHASISSMSLAGLAPMRQNVLFNFPDANRVDLTWIGIEGAILAPYAHFENPRGNINGQLIAKSWDGPMAINHWPFAGGLAGAVDCLKHNAIAVNEYHLGRAVFVGFDLLAEAFAHHENDPTAAFNPFADLLLSGLTHAHPDPLPLASARVVPLVVEINNAGMAASGEALLTFSDNLVVIDGAGFTIEEGMDGATWRFPFALAQSENHQQTLYVQLPETVGEAAHIDLLVQTGQAPDPIVHVETTYTMIAQ